MPGYTSKTSYALRNINEQIKSGKTRSANPRELSPEEITALKEQRDVLRNTLSIQAQERRIAKINSHTTVEANRVIQTVEDSTRDSKVFFQNVGGVGSSTDLRTQAQILAIRAKEKAKEEKPKHAQKLRHGKN